MKARPFVAMALLALSACAAQQPPAAREVSPPHPILLPGVRDPRIGLRAGWMDAAEAASGLRVVSRTEPSRDFLPLVPGDFAYMNSDLSISGHYVLQGNFSGVQVWDIADPAKPVLKRAFVCPGSQSDVSVFRNLLFVSGEALNGRTDCGTQGIRDTVDHHRLRGIRVFEISDIANPRLLANVQTCRGSHTHTVVSDPDDTANVYIYISGSGPVRSPHELEGCSTGLPEDDPNTALFRIEVIQVPLAAPQRSHIISSPRIFEGLARPGSHGPAPEDVAAGAAAARAARIMGRYTVTLGGVETILSDSFARVRLDSIVKARGGRGEPTAADSAALRGAIQGIIDRMIQPNPALTTRGPTQCHDITAYPAIGLAGGACGGYGLLLDIRDAAHPRRIGAVSDSNFSFWHSATFNNDGTKILFTDEWGGGLAPRCRVTDKKEWGANAIFTLRDSTMTFSGYYKLPVPQTPQENCVAHNGTLIPIPGRDVMVQGWYQGGVSVFDWTDPARPVEIAYFDRGPMDSTVLRSAGSWSAYWYNGLIVSSEIARGLDILELVPTAHISQNEIAAARLVRATYLNAQNQEKITWPRSFVVARAYVDQLERSKGLTPERLAAVRGALAGAEAAVGAARRAALTDLAAQLDGDGTSSSDAAKVRMLAAEVRALVTAP